MRYNNGPKHWHSRHNVNQFTPTTVHQSNRWNRAFSRLLENSLIVDPRHGGVVVALWLVEHASNSRELGSSPVGSRPGIESNNLDNTGRKLATGKEDRSVRIW